MLIITDSLEYSKGFGFDNFESFSSIEDVTLHNLASSILDDNSSLYQTKSDNPFWDYFFISFYSENSQYDSLIKLAQQITLDKNILCIAGSGKNFHGFHHRKWEATKGNIHLTVHLKPNQKIENFASAFMILSAISVVQTIDEIPALKNKSNIKWVNDIMIDNAKVGGVLAHVLSQSNTVTNVILGIGLNVETSPIVQPTEFVTKSSCLNEYLSDVNKVTHQFILEILIKKIADNYQLIIEDKLKSLIDFYRDRSLVLNKEVIIKSDEFGVDNKILHNGKVIAIGDNLELYFENRQKPIINGRLVFM